MTDWPSALPQAFTLGSYQSSRPRVVIRFQPDVGEASVRRRVTSAPMPFSGDMVMTRAQRNALVTFFDETTRGGALRFDFPAQDGTDNIWTCRFLEEPTERWLTASHWLVSMRMEVMTGGVTVTGGTWLLADGSWDDSGVWSDSDTWNDAP